MSTEFISNYLYLVLVITLSSYKLSPGYSQSPLIKGTVKFSDLNSLGGGWRARLGHTGGKIA